MHLELDPYDMRVVDGACTHLSPIEESFVRNLLIGEVMDECLDRAIREVRKRYFSVTRRAMIAALEDVSRRYAEYRSRNNTTA